MNQFQPKDPNIKIWRYLDLPKFIALLDSKKLHFSRADLLGDAQEGWIVVNALQRAKSDLQMDYKKFYNQIRASTFVSSWHMNGQESYAMWKLYAEKEQGVAIQTSYQNLLESTTDSAIFIGQVSYKDEVGEVDLANNEYECFMYKRACFEYEHEVRLITKLELAADTEEMPNGILVDINLNTLIERIYVHPYALNWYYDVIKSIIAKYYPPLLCALRWSSMKENV